MADIAAVLGRLTQDELNELRALGPSGARYPLTEIGAS